MGQVGNLRSVLLAGVVAAPLAGCGSLPDTGIGATLSTLSPFKATTSAEDAKLPTVAEALANERVTEVECPDIRVVDGQSAYRTFVGEQTNSNVRHQYSFGDLARECSVRDGKLIDIRIGISGYVLSGPKGGPGSFQVPVRVSVRQDAEDKVVATKSYRIAASIAQGEAQAPFILVTDPLTVPLLRQDAGHDYTILIGFDSSPDRPEPRSAQKPRR
jgi:hypothetical protein